MTKGKRSPFFYVGDKYKLMPQLKELFPPHIGTYVEPFLGGGSSLINTEADKYIVNDIDVWMIRLHKWLKKKRNVNRLVQALSDEINEYGLSCSYQDNLPPEELRKKYVKTYFARYNKEPYMMLKNDFNSDQKDIQKLYLLLIYGFNHMIRFNSRGEFNLPVGNVDFNKNVVVALREYIDFMEGHSDIVFYNEDYKSFLKKIDFNESFYVYFDPPYYISGSEYNKLWDEKNEIELYDCIDNLASSGIHFGLTNLVRHKGKTNEILLEWSKKYSVYDIHSNYISFNDNTIKKESKEVFVTNYGKK